LRVIEKAGKTKCGNYKWKCICDCGKEVVIKSGNLTRQKGTKSCGCLLSEKNIKRLTTHGKSKYKLYDIWSSMKARCADINDKNYGGKGITVCDEWSNDFDIFYSFSINNGWQPGLEIDRINNNGNYSPENCRFTNRIINCENKSNSKLWFINGNKYPSARKAAIGEKVHRDTILRWCGVIPWKNGELKEKEGCYSRLKYGFKNELARRASC